MEITETFKPKNRSEWRDWLQANHTKTSEIWLLFDKRRDVPSVHYLDAIEEAICFGWIDGIAKKYSEFETAQRLTPRRMRGNWTELNKERARRLIRLGLMTDVGQKTLPDLNANFSISNDIIISLKDEPGAWEYFESFPSLYQRARIGYIEEMRKKPTEFEKRLRNFIAQTAVGKMFGNWNDGGRLTDEQA